MMTRLKKYIISRFGEASTWKGIISGLVGAGVFAFTPAQTDAVVGIMLAIYTAGSIFFPDAIPKK